MDRPDGQGRRAPPRCRRVSNKVHGYERSPPTAPRSAQRRQPRRPSISAAPSGTLRRTSGVTNAAPLAPVESYRAHNVREGIDVGAARSAMMTSWVDAYGKCVLRFPRSSSSVSRSAPASVMTPPRRRPPMTAAEMAPRPRGMVRARTMQAFSPTATWWTIPSAVRLRATGRASSRLRI